MKPPIITQTFPAERVIGAYYFMPYGDTDDEAVGPYKTVYDLCHDLRLTDYPYDGMIVSWEIASDGTYLWGSVPSINPDDLLTP